MERSESFDFTVALQDWTRYVGSLTQATQGGSRWSGRRGRRGAPPSVAAPAGRPEAGLFAAGRRNVEHQVAGAAKQAERAERLCDAHGLCASAAAVGKALE